MTAELSSPPAGPLPAAGTARPRRPFEAWKWVSLGIWAVLVVWSIAGLDINWSRLVDAPQDLYRLFELMFSQLDWSDLSRCLEEMWYSIAMAWLGTLIASFVAVPLGFLAAEGLTSPTEASYRFVAHEPGVHVVLVGTGNPVHLEENVRALNAGPLPPEASKRLVSLFGHLSMAVDAPWRR